jgi:hypothetical protein
VINFIFLTNFANFYFQFYVLPLQIFDFLIRKFLIFKIFMTFANFLFFKNLRRSYFFFNLGTCKVCTSVERFSLFGDNWPISVLSWCCENLIGSLIQIFWAGENRSGYQFIFKKLTQLSDRAIFSYIQQQPVFQFRFFESILRRARTLKLLFSRVFPQNSRFTMWEPPNTWNWELFSDWAQRFLNFFL